MRKNKKLSFLVLGEKPTNKKVDLKELKNKFDNSDNLRPKKLLLKRKQTVLY